MSDSDDAPDSEEDAPESAVEPTNEGMERTTIRTGREFEQQYRLAANGAGEFLVELGEQLRDGEELTITDEEWELPFAFGEPVHLEVDFDGVGDPELEIELELPGRPDERPPSVE